MARFGNAPVGRLVVAALAMFLTAAPAIADPGQDRILFEAYCASCHGAMGRGDGVRTAGLHPPPADLTLLVQRYGTPLPQSALLSSVLDHGRTQRAGPCRDRALAWAPASAGRTFFVRGLGIAALRFVETLQVGSAEP